MHTKLGCTWKILDWMQKPISKVTYCMISFYMAFSKWQKYRDEEDISGCQAVEGYGVNIKG